MDVLDGVKAAVGQHEVMAVAAAEEQQLNGVAVEIISILRLPFGPARTEEFGGPGIDGGDAQEHRGVGLENRMDLLKESHGIFVALQFVECYGGRVSWTGFGIGDRAGAQ